jgi:hypothetical protein
VSLALARFLYRFRFPLTFLIVAGALLLSPRADHPHDNDLSVVHQGRSVLRDYDRLRREFTGSRTLIVAPPAPTSPPPPASTYSRITGDIERVP